MNEEMLKEINDLRSYNDFKVLAKDYKEGKLTIHVCANSELHILVFNNFEIE